jgi:DNA-binding MarR family transcriptional regulator
MPSSPGSGTGARPGPGPGPEPEPEPGPAPEQVRVQAPGRPGEAPGAPGHAPSAPGQASGVQGQPPSGPGQVVDAWRTIAASHAAACAALEHELGHRHGLGVSEFEVLDRLAESGDRKWRAQGLADAVHLSQSALSRLIDRLEKHGLVQRCLCDMDRRGVFITLTEAGRQRHAEAVPTHRQVLAGVLPTGLLVSCSAAAEAARAAAAPAAEAELAGRPA